ncbi:MAG: hypothetical protein GC155_06095 [Alphaproteobacteria bacterium]|nr:hypothetical protein [Alphaproteobacteria bacterium]
MEHYRQGDVCLRAVTGLPAGLVQERRDAHGRIVLAHGERTGHAHAIRNPAVDGFRFQTSEHDVNAGLFDFILVGGAGATLKHELISGAKAEHGSVKVPPGAYEVLQQTEYTPAELVRVSD